MAPHDLTLAEFHYLDQMCDTMNLLDVITRGISISISEVVVRSGGLEPPRVLPHSDLNAARLPIPPRPRG